MTQPLPTFTRDQIEDERDKLLAETGPCKCEDQTWCHEGSAWCRRMAAWRLYQQQQQKAAG